MHENGVLGNYASKRPQTTTFRVPGDSFRIAGRSLTTAREGLRFSTPMFVAQDTRHFRVIWIGIDEGDIVDAGNGGREEKCGGGFSHPLGDTKAIASIGPVPCPDRDRRYSCFGGIELSTKSRYIGYGTASVRGKMRLVEPQTPTPPPVEAGSEITLALYSPACRSHLALECRPE